MIRHRDTGTATTRNTICWFDEGRRSPRSQPRVAKNLGLVGAGVIAYMSRRGVGQTPRQTVIRPSSARLATRAAQRWTKAVFLLSQLCFRANVDERRAGAIGGGRRGAAPANPRNRRLLPTPRHARLWRAGRAVRADGKGVGRREGLADQGRDAGRDCGLASPSRPRGDPGRHLHCISARRFLGRLGRRVGIHPAQFP